MRRKTFDALLTSAGTVVAIVLIAAGALLTWAHSFVGDQVHSQLASQQIFFPPAAAFANPKAGTEITPSMVDTIKPYAGQQLLTGPQAKAYADNFIAVHLSEMPYGGVYSKVSAAALADPKNAALQAEVNTVFRGTSLRSMLLSAYAFSTMGFIAGIAAIISFIAAGVMLILSALGLAHLRRTPGSQELRLGARTPAPTEV